MCILFGSLHIKDIIYSFLIGGNSLPVNMGYVEFLGKQIGGMLWVTQKGNIPPKFMI